MKLTSPGWMSWESNGLESKIYPIMVGNILMIKERLEIYFNHLVIMVSIDKIDDSSCTVRN